MKSSREGLWWTWNVVEGLFRLLFWLCFSVIAARIIIVMIEGQLRPLTERTADIDRIAAWLLVALLPAVLCRLALVIASKRRTRLMERRNPELFQSALDSLGPWNHYTNALERRICLILKIRHLEKEQKTPPPPKKGGGMRLFGREWNVPSWLLIAGVILNASAVAGIASGSKIVGAVSLAVFLLEVFIGMLFGLLDTVFHFVSSVNGEERGHTELLCQ